MFVFVHVFFFLFSCTVIAFGDIRSQLLANTATRGVFGLLSGDV